MATFRSKICKICILSVNSERKVIETLYYFIREIKQSSYIEQP